MNLTQTQHGEAFSPLVAASDSSPQVDPSLATIRDHADRQPLGRGQERLSGHADQELQRLSALVRADADRHLLVLRANTLVARERLLEKPGTSSVRWPATVRSVRRWAS